MSPRLITTGVFTLIIFLAVMAVPTTQANYSNDEFSPFRVKGLSAFTDEQRNMLRNWLKLGVNAQRDAFGTYPFTLNLYVYPRQSNQPVPWAHTRRDHEQSVHLYVDTRFKLNDFVDDWTLYHELSHLALPYLGSRYAWFSEGFASYMQYQLMAKAERLDASPIEKYHTKIAPHLNWFDTDLSSADMASYLMKKHHFPAAYWGGAWFFVIAEQQLQNRHAMGLTTLISQYQLCCRMDDDNIQALVTSLDGLIEDSLFTDLLTRFETEPARDIYPRQF